MKKYFGGRFWWFGNICEFIEQELGLGDLRGAHKPSGCPPGVRPLVSGFLGKLLAPSLSPTGVFWSKKNHGESSILFGLRLIFLSEKAKNKEKNISWHSVLG